MKIFRTKPALFEAYPALEGKIPWVRLGDFPTPIKRLKKLGKALGAPELYVKREDKSGPLYGGNKIRKLEFSLADALEQGKKTVVTFGGCGSNHVLATTIYGKTVGLETAAFLTPQPANEFVARNIRAYSHFGTKMYYIDNAKVVPRRLMTLAYLMALRLGYILPPGGSNVRGTLGFVDAAIEIKRQIEKKAIPEPKKIYVAAGSGGTLAGLIVGARLVGLKSEIIGVRAAASYMVNRIIISILAQRTANLLREHNPSIPAMTFSQEDVILKHEYYGKGYGCETNECVNAMDIMEKKEGIHLESTYTGKTFAAVIDDIKRAPKTPALFINTYNSVDIYSKLPKICDTRPIPSAMRHYVAQK